MGGEEGSASWGSAFRSLSRILVIYGAFWSINWLNADVLGAFIRTLVHCSVDYCEKHAKHAGDCAAHPRNSRDWSGSEYCLDKNYVLVEQTRINSDLASMSTAIQCFIIPLLGAAADVYGRKRIMVSR